MTQRTNESEQDMVDIKEAETEAAATLAPDSMPATNMTKAGMMATMMQTMNGMTKSELVDFFNKSMAQFGPNADLGVPGDAAAKNVASIATKGAVEESVEQMFAGNDLSEDFKHSVSTLIESAVAAQLNVAIAEVVEEHEREFDELVEDYKQEISEQIDEYLDYVCKEWVEQNKVAIESEVKLEIQESFLEGLRNLFAEHYIDVPSEKRDLIGEMQAKIDQLTNTVNEIQNKNIQLAAVNEDLKRDQVLSTMASDLTESEAAKFYDLAEGLSYKDLQHYTKKLNVIKETYFVKAPQSNLTEDEEIMGIASLNEETGDEQPKYQDPAIAAYAKAISRTTKR